MKFPNSGIGIMQDVPQIEAFSIPLHVELTELLGFDFDLVQNCAKHRDWQDATHCVTALFYDAAGRVVYTN